MRELKLREEFLGAHMPGTAISLRTSDNQGAAAGQGTYPAKDMDHIKKTLRHIFI